MRAGAEGGGCFPTGRHYPGIAHLLRVAAQGLANEFDAQTAVTELSLVSLDTETTGRDAETDRVIEVGGVVWRNGDIIARHGWLINPGCPIPKEAFDVHGISDDDVRDKPSFAEVLPEIVAAFAGAVPVAYNAEFDKGFLLAELSRAGRAPATLPPAFRSGVEWIDPLVWARTLQADEKSRALADVAERLGAKPQTSHRAVADAETSLFVLRQFLQDSRVPDTYGAFIREQRRLAYDFNKERQARWNRPS